MTLYDKLMEMINDFNSNSIKICELELSFEASLDEDGGKIFDVNLKNTGICDIVVYKTEGNNVAHFHIISRQRNKNNPKFDCAIMINQNRYFDHGKYKDTLNSKQLKELKAKLEEINPETKNNYWKDIQNAFYNNFPDCIEKRVDKIPDYSNIKLYKEK